MPISHSYGLTLLQGMLFVGAHLRIMPRFSLTQAIDAVVNGSLTAFNAVPCDVVADHRLRRSEQYQAHAQ